MLTIVLDSVCHFFYGKPVTMENLRSKNEYEQINAVNDQRKSV